MKVTPVLTQQCFVSFYQPNSISTLGTRNAEKFLKITSLQEIQSLPKDQSEMGLDANPFTVLLKTKYQCLEACRNAGEGVISNSQQTALVQ